MSWGCCFKDLLPYVADCRSRVGLLYKLEWFFKVLFIYMCPRSGKCSSVQERLYMMVVYDTFSFVAGWRWHKWRLQCIQHGATIESGVSLWIYFFIFYFFNFPSFETEGRQANIEAQETIDHLPRICQVERRFHSWESNCQPWLLRCGYLSIII